MSSVTEYRDMNMPEENDSILTGAFQSSELDALIRLLDDPDEIVTLMVREKLSGYGTEILPVLRPLLHATTNSHVRATLEQIIHARQHEALMTLQSTVIHAIGKEKDIDLEEAVIHLSKFGYPETSSQEISEKLDKIALRIHALFMKVQHHDDLNLLMSINRAFFEEEHFHGAEQDYYHPDHSYLHTVMHSREGIPISLSVLYMLVAERAGVDLYGIGMPAHFVVFHPELNVFIDTFNNGRFLTENDCRKFIQDCGYQFSKEMLNRASNISILVRLLRNVIHAHTKRNEQWETGELQGVLDTIIGASHEG